MSELCHSCSALGFTARACASSSCPCASETLAGSIVFTAGSMPTAFSLGGRWVKVERKERSFTRSFVLPKNADPDKIAARLEKGVLTVSVAKREVVDEGAKKIEVTMG